MEKKKQKKNKKQMEIVENPEQLPVTGKLSPVQGSPGLFLNESGELYACLVYPNGLRYLQKLNKYFGAHGRTE